MLIYRRYVSSVYFMGIYICEARKYMKSARECAIMNAITDYKKKIELFLGCEKIDKNGVIV